MSWLREQGTVYDLKATHNARMKPFNTKYIANMLLDETVWKVYFMCHLEIDT